MNILFLFVLIMNCLVGLNQCSLNYSTVNLYCYGGDNGEIDIIPIGTPPFAVSVNNTVINETSQGFVTSGLIAGDYIIESIDSLGCSAVDTITITEPEEMVIYTSIEQPVSSFTPCNGLIGASVFGGTPSYEYIWYNCLDSTPVHDVTTIGINYFCPGDYFVLVTDNHGCQDTSDCISMEVLNIDEINHDINVIFKESQLIFSEDNLSVKLFNTNGQILIDRHLDTESLIVECLNNGIYILQIRRADNSMITKKVLIN